MATKKTAVKSRATKKSSIKKGTKKRRSEKSKAVGKKSVIFLPLLLIVLLGFLFTFHRHIVFGSIPHPIKHLEVSTTGSLSKNFLARVLPLRETDDLRSLDIQTIRRSLLKFSQVCDVHIDCVYPDRLRIRVVERVPAFRIPKPDSDTFLFMDPDGFIFESLSLDAKRIARFPLLEFDGCSDLEPFQRLHWGSQIYHFWQQSSQLRPKVVQTWTGIYVGKEWVSGSGHLDVLEVRSSLVKHLLFNPESDLERAFDELIYILSEARKKHLLPLSRVDLTVANRAFVKPSRLRD